MICSNKFLLILLSLFAGVQLFAAPPVPFSGKLAVDGTNFHGHALFSFSIVDGEGTVHWKHSQEANATIENFVMNGRYLVLLGGQGMQTLPADLFLQHESLFLRVSVDLKDGKGMRLLEPDQRITSSPYALSAEIARLAERAQVAGGVDTGAITADMLDQALLADLNRTFELGLISRDMLEQGVRDELNASITLDRLSAEVRADLNRTIGITNLSSEVTEKLNREFTIEPGSIGKALLAQDVRDDLNRTITRDRLSLDLIADLNRTVLLQDLSAEVSQSINRPITREMLPQGVRDELNATITRERLSADVRADLNRTIGIANLSTEVTDKLNQTFAIDAGSITLDQLSQQVRDDINRTITRDRLSSDVLSDINRTITKSMLSQEVLDELNATGGTTGSVPGSLFAVLANQSAPSGYELYQMGNRKNLVWEEKAPVSVARYAGNCVKVLGGKIYFIGGWIGSNSQNITERYDPVTNTWETLSSMSTVNEGLALAVLNGKLYAIKGHSEFGVEVFDPSTDSWSSGVSLPSEVKYGSSITVNEMIYLIGGWNGGDQHMNQVLCFDPSTSQWSTKANMPTARHGMSLVWFENRIWAIGGRPESNVVESYDPDTDSWRAESSISIERGWNSAWVANGLVFVAGGSTSGGFLNTIEKYDPTTKKWSPAGSFPENRWAVGTAVLNGIVYLIAGHDGSTYSNKVFAADLNASMEGVHDLYVKTGDASTGTPTVQAEVADGSITTNQLSEQILKYLKPEITQQPTTTTIFAGSNHTISVSAEGKYLTYQWKKNGVNLEGETNATLSITDANATQHDGNYSVVVSNDFGSVETILDTLIIDESIMNGLVAWWKFDELEGNVSFDSSGNGNDGNLTNEPTRVNGKIGGALSFDGENDYIEVPVTAYPLGNSANISFWALGGTNLPKSTFVFEARNNSDLYLLNLHLTWSSYTLIWDIGSGGEYNRISKIGTSTDFKGSWVFWNLSKDGNSGVMNVHKNGQLWESQDNKNIPSADISEIVYFRLGVGYHGILDDIRIYNRPLSADEVSTLYELGL